jgi:predicted PurR-regulated permease PerM
MLNVLFGSTTGILSIITVLGALLVVVFWAIYWFMHFGKDK